MEDFTFGYIILNPGDYWIGYEDSTDSFNSGLGSSGDVIVFADADEKSVERGVLHCFNNSGQSCNAPTRMLVQREIYDKAVNVYDSFNTVNQSLDKARLKMDEAKSRLQDGPGSLTKKIEKMKKLGRLNTKKQLPEDSGNAID